MLQSLTGHLIPPHKTKISTSVSWFRICRNLDALLLELPIFSSLSGYVLYEFLGVCTFEDPDNDNELLWRRRFFRTMFLQHSIAVWFIANVVPSIRSV
jgi:hypothetical protein